MRDSKLRCWWCVNIRSGCCIIVHKGRRCVSAKVDTFRQTKWVKEDFVSKGERRNEGSPCRQPSRWQIDIDRLTGWRQRRLTIGADESKEQLFYSFLTVSDITPSQVDACYRMFDLSLLLLCCFLAAALVGVGVCWYRKPIVLERNHVVWLTGFVVFEKSPTSQVRAAIKCWVNDSGGSPRPGSTWREPCGGNKHDTASFIFWRRGIASQRTRSHHLARLIGVFLENLMD